MKMTKVVAKSANSAPRRFEVALAYDAGTAKGGMYGLTDLFTYANGFAAKRRYTGASPLVRITHWQSEDTEQTVRCTYDSCPDVAYAPTVVIIPNNGRAISEPEHKSPLVEWLLARHAEGAVLAAVCGGVFMLAKTGLLVGRQATTHWAHATEFAMRFPDVLMESDHMVIDCGDVLTAGGAMAWADLGLRLTEQFLGAAVMHETAHYMNIDPPGREQRFYSRFEPSTKHGDVAILQLQQWLSSQRNLAVSVTDMAQKAGLESRTFLRRFVQATGMKPTEYQQRLRMSRAREMLECSQSSVELIAGSVGYQDVRGFRRVFYEIVGLTPSDYRRRFSRREKRAGT